jgi:hypothetical protein
VLAVNVSVFHRRRAERFAQLLDEAGGARRHHVRSQADPDLTDLVEVGHRLGRIDVGVQADPEFRTGLRAMLMATIEREGIGATAVAPEVTAEPVRRPIADMPKIAWIPLHSRRARGAVVVGLAVGTLAVSGMSAASGDAKPGDALYGMKRSAERAQLALSSSQLGRGQLYLEFAKTRINEAATGRGDVAGILEDMDNETREGVQLLTASAVDRRDPAALDAVDAFVADQRHTIAGMLGALTGAARTRTVSSLTLLDDVKNRVDGLRANLNCGDVATLVVDELGPRPTSCATHSPVSAGGATNVSGNHSTAPSSTGIPAAGPPVTAVDPAPGEPGRPAPRPGPHASPTSTPGDGDRSGSNILDRIVRLLG